MSTLESRALSAYFRHSDGLVAQPSGDPDVIDHQGLTYVVLSNVNGTLAVYRHLPAGQLKRMKRWPEEVAPR
ncbi:hypothetical protein ACGFXC_10475 [Streptomyces sp. NPDC048507]|uniref:hypothetical protein n=1 Tax=Streptomyces sp. NPDC048507 TaxID=3365560 RepID=UPI0037166D6D